jgi:hypothetical protein
MKHVDCREGIVIRDNVPLYEEAKLELVGRDDIGVWSASGTARSRMNDGSAGST